MERRTKIDIIAKILELTKARCRKTKIMYHANLSHELLVYYLNYLCEKGLIDYNHEQSCYEIKEKGLIFLQHYYELKKTLNAKDEEMLIIKSIVQ